MVHHYAAGIAGAHALEQAELERLGLLEAIGGDRIDDRDAERLVMSQDRRRVEEHALVTPRVRGGTGPVHDLGVAGTAITWIERVIRVIDLLPRQAAPVQLVEKPS